MRRTLVLLTPVSRAHCAADFRGDVLNVSKTIAEEAGLVAIRGLPDLPFEHHKWCHVYQTCHKAVQLSSMLEAVFETHASTDVEFQRHFQT